MNLIQLNKVGGSPEFYELNDYSGGIAIGSFISTWPLAWLVLYFNIGSDGTSSLWADMWSEGLLNFIACNIVLFIQSWCWLVVEITFGIVNFLF